jgi:pimeloyl-ACP methyl ester carboxylesterase
MRLVHGNDTAPDAAHRLWHVHDEAMARLVERFRGHYRQRSFDHVQPLRLQPGVPARLRKPYTTPVGYTEWGPPDAPIVVCAGGVANTAMRFAFLAAELSMHYRVICMDWVGRGRSGWLADASEYTLPTYVEQLRQMVDHVAGEAGASRAPVTLVGSSMGGSVAIEFASQRPARVQRLVLNDVGPSIPRARRRRRAETLSRFYVFRTPEELARRVGAAHKNDGPVSDEIRQFIAFHQTRWSPENAGRVYRLDPRALMAYRDAAQDSLDQWQAWRGVRCPVLLLHGMASDALSAQTIARMRRTHAVTVAHIPDTGHTPVLSDRNQTHQIVAWLRGDARDAVEFSIPHALPRQAWPVLRDAGMG